MAISLCQLSAGQALAQGIPLVATTIRLVHADAVAIEALLKSLLSESGSLMIDERTNSLILRDDESSVRAIKDALTELDTEIPSQRFLLNYADPDEVAAEIDRIVGPGAEVVEPDTRTHTVYVAAREAWLNRVRGLIDDLDRPSRQVLIEADILDVSTGKLKELGVEWELRLGYDGGGKDFVYRNNARRANVEPPSTGTISVGTPTVTIPAIIDPLTGILITPAQSIAGSDFSATIQALVEDSSTQVLSRPRILVLDGHQARFNVSSREPYADFEPATGGGTAYSLEIKFLDIGIVLEVLPRINDEDYVTMEVRAKISTLAGEALFETTLIPDEGGALVNTLRVPIEAESVADTVVMVRSGQTIAIGGLGSRKEMESISKVPILGDIPILGIPFRNLNQSRDTRELIIFITPHIISPDVSSPESKMLESVGASVEPK
jgi:type II secretory pathway component GspD/PulD (secretin)